MPELQMGDVYDGLKQLLPKLAQPSWVWQIGEPFRKSAVLASIEAEKVLLDKKVAKKEAKRRHKAYRRFALAIQGTA